MPSLVLDMQCLKYLIFTRKENGVSLSGVSLSFHKIARVAKREEDHLENFENASALASTCLSHKGKILHVAQLSRPCCRVNRFAG